MSDHSADHQTEQERLRDPKVVRSFLDQLLADSRLYTQSEDYKALLDFVVRLRNFAPFNAMLLQVQKPGLSYAASARDWRERFGRKPTEGARPLLILWPFGPVALAYDVMDTEGKPLPQDVSPFSACGEMDEIRLRSFERLLEKKNIEWRWVDAGDRKAGSIRVVQRPVGAKGATHYRIHINRNHDVTVKFATLTHELGHLFLGHLGPDTKLHVAERLSLSLDQRELEAESVAYLVCGRNGLEVRSQPYLSNFLNGNAADDHIDVYQVMRAAGQIEALLGLTSHTQHQPKRGRKYSTPGESLLF